MTFFEIYNGKVRLLKKNLNLDLISLVDSATYEIFKLNTFYSSTYSVFIAVFGIEFEVYVKDAVSI